MNALVGIDLGTINDYTAVSVIEQRAVYSREHGRETQYDVRHLERYLGEPYTAIITRIQGVLRKLKDPKVVVDGTGVGRPVIDLMRERGISPVVPVIITGGDSVTEEVVDGRREFRVPKRDLVGCLQVLLQNRQLRIPSSLDLRSELVTEMQNFRVKISAETGHDSYEHWRSSDHDDLVLSIALPCWYAESRPERIPMGTTKGIVRRSSRAQINDLLREFRR